MNYKFEVQKICTISRISLLAVLRLPHVGQYRQREINQLQQVEKICVTYSHTIKFLGLTVKDCSAPPISLSTQSQIIRLHIIKNSVWDVFQFEDPLTTKTNVNFLTNMGRFQLGEVKKQMGSVKVTSEFHALQNLEKAKSWMSYLYFLIDIFHSSFYKGSSVS